YKEDLNAFIVSKDAKTINDDSSSRYFESTYALELLKINPTQQLTIEELNRHYRHLCEQLTPEIIEIIEKKIFRDDFSNVEKKDGVDLPTSLIAAKEYSDLIQKLESKDFLPGFTENREKLLIIA